LAFTSSFLSPTTFPGDFIDVAFHFMDSAVTMKIKTKTKPASEHLTSLGRIHVDTDQNGVVWLTGSARSQQAIDKTVSLARNTEHVKSVHSHIVIKQDD
jgi:hyperosmotically inducible protein